MYITTVQGAINSDKLGITLSHEHVLIDISNQFSEFSEPSEIAISKQKVGLSNLDMLSRNPYAVKDNLVLNNKKVAKKELKRFVDAGGSSLIDATVKGMGQDPETLLNISQSLGINIIAGCGYYTHDTHPRDMDSKKVEDIRKEMLNDINKGINGTRIKAGMLGELGVSKEIHPNEKKVLIAAAQTQAETGVGIMVHTFPWSNDRIKIIEILKRNRARIDKVVICHVDVELSLQYCRRLLDEGVYIGFDNFGHEFYVDKKNRQGFLKGTSGIWARDIERVKYLKSLIDQGFLSKVLISTDICQKTALHKYGGWGYDHILINIVPMMLEANITEDEVNTILIENPKRFLE